LDLGDARFYRSIGTKKTARILESFMVIKDTVKWQGRGA
jgi:hypothetical protein